MEKIFRRNGNKFISYNCYNFINLKKKLNFLIFGLKMQLNGAFALRANIKQKQNL